MSQSKNDIDSLLKQMGAIAIQWTDTIESIKGLECPVLQFAVVRKSNGIEQRYVVKLQAPALTELKGTKYNKKKSINLNASMRLLYWYVKSKSEAMRYGLEEFVEAFMANILIPLPDGSTTTMGEALKNKPEMLAKTFQLSDFGGH